MAEQGEFNSLNDAVEWLRQQEALHLDAALDSLHPKQLTIGYGSYWLRVVDDVIVFGYVMTPDEVLQGEIAAGADTAEAESTVKATSETFKRGYLFGRAWSTLCPDGEYGSTHASYCWPITEDQFADAKANDWNPQLILVHGKDLWLAEILMDITTATPLD